MSERRDHQQSTSQMTSYQRYLTQRRIILLFVAAYVAVAYLGGRMSPRGEFFPVFNWSLFTYVAETRSLPEVYVYRIGNERFASPRPYSELGAYFELARKRSTDGKKILERALRAREPEERRQLVRVLENRLFDGQAQVDYEIRIVRFNPLHRWRDGAIQQSVTIYRNTTTS